MGPGGGHRLIELSQQPGTGATAMVSVWQTRKLRLREIEQLAQILTMSSRAGIGIGAWIPEPNIWLRQTRGEEQNLAHQALTVGPWLLPHPGSPSRA